VVKVQASALLKRGVIKGMANGDTGEKTEEATPKKLRDARKKGQVAKSQDMNTAVLLIDVFGVLFATMSSMCEYMQYLMRTCFVYAPQNMYA